MAAAFSTETFNLCSIRWATTGSPSSTALSVMLQPADPIPLQRGVAHPISGVLPINQWLRFSVPVRKQIGLRTLQKGLAKAFNGH